VTARHEDFELGISEADLSTLTRDLVAAHNDTLPAMQAEAEEFGADLRDQMMTFGAGRRGFLMGVGAIGAGLALAACGSESSRTNAMRPVAFSRDLAEAEEVSAEASKYKGDLRIVAFAAALENQAVVAYGAALKAAGEGKYGKVPAAVGVFAQTARKQHDDHAAGWNSVLRKAGLPAVKGVPLSTFKKTAAALGKAKNIGQVAGLALTLEDEAAATYLLAIGAVTNLPGVRIAATIAPVESMHSAILNFVLGKYPVPVAVLTTKDAANPATFTG
jgi:hypothetical protein